MVLFLFFGTDDPSPTNTFEFTFHRMGWVSQPVNLHLNLRAVNNRPYESVEILHFVQNDNNNTE